MDEEPDFDEPESVEELDEAEELAESEDVEELVDSDEDGLLADDVAELDLLDSERESLR